MTISPRQNASDPVSVRIESNSSLVDVISLTSVCIEQCVNRIPRARLEFAYEPGPSSPFLISDSKDFEPGAEVAIKIGYDDRIEPAFKGFVVRHELASDLEAGTRLIVECRDAVYAMDLDRKSNIFPGQKDSQTIRALLSNYAGVKARVADSGASVAEQVQYQMTDWEYLIKRAGANGMVAVIDQGVVSVGPPDVSAPAIELTTGEIIRIKAHINAHVNPAPELSSARGAVSIPGSSLVKAGSFINLTGVSKAVDGKVCVRQVEHHIHEGDWVTHVEFGLDSNVLAENNSEEIAPDSLVTPLIAGLQVGTVKELQGDPEGQFRIQVQIRGLGDNSLPVWARVASPLASNGFGSFFIPEMGDEVVLGFLHDSTSEPIIVGSLYGKSRPPAAPFQLDNANNLKGLVTRSKLSVELDEESKSIAISTPAGNSVVLSDDESVTLTDERGSKVTLNGSGVSIDSSKDVTINAKGKLTLNAGTALDLSAQSNITVSGLNISNTAKIGFVANGSATAELSAGGQTTVKGAMVMIN